MNFQREFQKQLAAVTPRGAWARVERAVARALPGIGVYQQQKRMQYAKLRAQGAYSNRGRENAGPSYGEESPQKRYERKQLQWNAMDELDNSGLCESITGKFADYLYGSLRYQQRTGDPHINEQHESIMRERLGSVLDYTGRHSLRTQGRISIRGRIVKGGVGAAFVRPEPDSPYIYLQWFEYDRIGGLWDNYNSANYSDGIGICPVTGAEWYFDIYNRNRYGGVYQFGQRFSAYDEQGRRQFLHLYNAKDFDGYKGTTAFKQSIDLVHYIKDIQQFEMQALQLAGTETIVYNTKDGGLPPSVFDQQRGGAGAVTQEVDAEGRITRVLRIGGARVSAMEVGEEMKMFEHNRVTPNVLAGLNMAVNEVCISTGLPMTFVTGQSGMNGPGVRFEGKQAERVINSYWEYDEEAFIQPVLDAILGNEIAQGRAPFHPLWRKHRCIGPESLTIDAGDTSTADLNERAEGITTGARLAAKRGLDIDEVRRVNSLEVKEDTKAAIQIAKDIQLETGILLPHTLFLGMLRRGQNASSGVQALATAPAQTVDDPNAGASTDGTPLPDDDTKKQLRTLQREVIEIREGRAVQLAAFHADVRVGDLPEDVRNEIRRFVPNASDDMRLPKYGMVAGELAHKADPANFAAARAKSEKLTRIACAARAMETAKAGKHILLNNQTIVDGHHYLADAERGRITSSLNVIDLTPARFQFVS